MNNKVKHDTLLFSWMVDMKYFIQYPCCELVAHPHSCTRVNKPRITSD